MYLPGKTPPTPMTPPTHRSLGAVCTVFLSRRSVVWMALCAILLLSGCYLFRHSAHDNPLELTMIRVEGGRFMMGDIFEEKNDDALPVHRVKIKTFYLSQYEVTYEQYDAFADSTGRPLPEDDGFGRGKRAVAHVTWDDAVAFCAYHRFRLPTEAEWEYAARSGGLEQMYAGTNTEDSLSGFAFYGYNSLGFSAPVGLKKPNSLGFYDLSGNVSEWVGDFYEKYPATGEKPVFKDLSQPSIRIFRGGSFKPSADFPRPTDLTRTYWRAGTLNDISSSSIGYRCAK